MQTLPLYAFVTLLSSLLLLSCVPKQPESPPPPFQKETHIKTAPPSNQPNTPRKLPTPPKVAQSREKIGSLLTATVPKLDQDILSNLYQNDVITKFQKILQLYSYQKICPLFSSEDRDKFIYSIKLIDRALIRRIYAGEGIRRKDHILYGSYLVYVAAMDNITLTNEWETCTSPEIERMKNDGLEHIATLGTAASLLALSTENPEIIEENVATMKRYITAP